MVATLHSVFPRRDLDHFSTHGYARNNDVIKLMRMALFSAAYCSLLAR